MLVYSFQRLSECESKRRYIRAEWSAPVVVVGRRGVLRGEGANISEGGVAVALRHPLSDLTVNIEIPNFAASTAMLLRAVRRHYTDGLYGFEFTSVSPAQAAILRRLVHTGDA